MERKIIEWKKEGFNEEQIEALKSKFPILVIAGPGTGKTKLLVGKIIDNVENVLDVKKTLSLTFTNKAANNILNRLSEKLGIELERKLFYIGTFHGVFYKLLSEYKQDFCVLFKFFKFPKIIEPSDNLHFFKRLIKINIFEENYEKMKEKEIEEEFYKKFYFTIEELYYEIEKQINLSPKDSKSLFDNLQNFITFKNNDVREEDKNELLKTIRNFFNDKKQYGLISFQDILLYFNSFLKRSPQFKKQIQEKFKYIFIDEYQDTNPIQDDIVFQMVNEDNYFIVGDPYQSIYKFLGADVNNILSKTNKPNINVIQLRRNYRSNQNIVDLTNLIIKDFKEQIPNFKELISNENNNLKNRKIEIYDYINQEEFIVDKTLELLKDKNVKKQEIAVISRTNFETFKLESLFLKNGIKYRKKGGSGFFDKKEVKIILSFSKILANLEDYADIEKTLPYFKGISNNKVSNHINNYLKNTENNITLRKYLKENCFKTNTKGEKIKDVNLENSLNILFKPLDLNVKNLKELLNNENLKIIESLEREKKTTSKKKEFQNTIDFLFKELDKIFSTNKIENFENFLSDVMLDKQKNEKDGDEITIITAHSAKGLEWKYVFILNCEDGIFPSKKSINTVSELEEERRLFYVSISRAKELLFLLSGGNLNSFISDHTNNNFVNISRNENFIKGFDSQDRFIKDELDFF